MNCEACDQGHLSPPNSHDATIRPRLPPFRSPPFLPLPCPFTGSGGIIPGKFFGITDARRRVLEHFGHKNQHLYEPGFLTGSCKFWISSKCACSIVNRWSSVCDHLTEIPSFCWVIAAYASAISSDRGWLAVAAITLYRISSNFFSPPPKISMTQRASFPP